MARIRLLDSIHAQRSYGIDRKSVDSLHVLVNRLQEVLKNHLTQAGARAFPANVAW
jgi:hypothetical protein